MVGYLVDMDFAGLDLHVFAERQRGPHYSILDLNTYPRLLLNFGDFIGNVYRSQGKKLPHVLDCGCSSSAEPTVSIGPCNRDDELKK